MAKKYINCRETTSKNPALKRCLPSYTCRLNDPSDNGGGSKNWTNCNMLNFFNKTKRAKSKNKYNTYKKLCKKELESGKVKTKIKRKDYLKHKEISIYTKILHKKMPYIWRFLNKNTCEKMIWLAKKPISEINIGLGVKSAKKMENWLKKNGKI